MGYELSQLRSSTDFLLAEFLIASMSTPNAPPGPTSDLRLKLPHLTSLSWLGVSTRTQGSVCVCLGVSVKVEGREPWTSGPDFSCRHHGLT